MSLHVGPVLGLLAAVAVFQDADRRKVVVDEPEVEVELAEVRGRLLLPDGSPAAGVRVELHGWQANQERVIEFGLPESWRDPSAETDDGGRFRIRLDPPRAFQFTLDAALEGFAEVSWRWSELPATEITDVGEVTLPRAGTVVGQIVDGEGRPVSGNWMVYADSSFRPPGSGGDRTRSIAPADRETGVFRLGGLPPGRAQLKAHSRIANWIDGPVVEVVANDEIEADIVYSGPDNSRRIVVNPSSRPFHSFLPEEGSILLHTPLGDTLTSKKIEGSSQSYSFEDLEPGDYTVEIADPRFVAWSQSGVQPGTAVRARLEGSAAVVLSVVDGETGSAVDDFRLLVDFEWTNRWPRVFELRGTGVGPAPGGVYDGLIPADQTLVVEAPGHATQRVELRELEPGERKGLTVYLVRGVRLHGQVREGHGLPAGGVTVHLEPFVENDAAEAGWAPPNRSRSKPLRAAETDPDGRFELTRVPSGSFRVVAGRNAYVQAELARVNVSGEDVELQLVLPDWGFVDGRLLVPTGAELDGLSVIGHPTAVPGEERFWIDAEELPVAAVDERGAFRCGPLPAGRADLELRSSATFEGTTWHEPISLGTTEVLVGPPGRTVEFDLRERLAGSLEISVVVDGRPAHGLVYSLHRMEASMAGEVPYDGRIRPLSPGTWTVLVRSDVWVAAVPALVTVPPGGTAHCDIEVTLHAGSVLVVDAGTGEPMPDRVVRVDAGHGASGTLTTNATGRLEARLPAGSYRLRDGGDGEGLFLPTPDTVELEWTSTGPTLESIRLERASRHGD